MTLYNMTMEAQQLYDALVDAELEPQEREQVITDTMAAMGADDKLESYCQIVRQMEAEQAVFAQEIDRLNGEKRRRSNGIDRMKDVMLSYYEATGAERPIEAGTFRVSKRKSDRVVITDEALVPDAWWKVKREPDKTAMKKEMKAGTEIPGAALEDTWSIQIR